MPENKTQYRFGWRDGITVFVPCLVLAANEKRRHEVGVSLLDAS